MPFVACPSCGERGKIPPTLVGARIKCKKCGSTFSVAPPAAKAQAGSPVGAGVAEAGVTPAHGTPHEGIAVDGLDASAWAVTSDPSGDVAHQVGPDVEHHAAEGDSAPAFETQGPSHYKEYKFICSRDKIFEGKFDLPRLEEVLNTHARQGWVVKGMSAPHLKDFGGVAKEEVVVLLER